MSTGWHFWIDRGGTFTDILARTPSGDLLARKLLSDNPDAYQDAAVAGISTIVEEHGASTDDVASLRMGTTAGTNALLQRTGEPTVMVVTKGFADLLRIGYQNRPDLFALEIKRPDHLPELVIEAEERISSDGSIVVPIDEDRLSQKLQESRAKGYRSIAIAFMHGYKYPIHEQRAAALARKCGFSTVVTSHEASPLPRIVSRAETTVVDAYLSPILNRYLSSVRAALDTANIFMMQSNGGLAHFDSFRGKDSLYSGPSGGVVGMVRTANEAGYVRLVGFDMGGTSTDVSLYDGTVERREETTVAGVRVRAPAIDVHSVAAGGGSIVRFDGDRLRVGPESAEANPGPACYRRGGPLTITDCNVLLGRIRPDFFPSVFGTGGDLSIDAQVVREKLGRLANEISTAYRTVWTAEEVAMGFLRVAVVKMANAIREISIDRGFDVTDFVLSCFGGASGQHACAVAEELGIKKILIHPLCGLLSAYGIGLADLSVIEQRAVDTELSEDLLRTLEPTMKELEAAASEALALQGPGTEDSKVVARLQVRYEGSDTSLAVGIGRVNEIREEFENLHHQYFGYDRPERGIIVTSITVEATGGGRRPTETLGTGQTRSRSVHRTGRVWLDGGWTEAPLYWRNDLPVGARFEGPVIVAEEYATTVVEKGWVAEVTPRRDLVLVRLTPRRPVAASTSSADPVLLEVFNNLFRHIAEQMGRVLQKTARSVNVKERLDFSCAVFDAHGDLVANAPHIPVHLGSMSDSVKRIAELYAERTKPGDSFLINDPYHGGTHLPDLTVVTPVFAASGASTFFVASRAHHADIGGLQPGSMPADSKSIDEEGVLFPGDRITTDGRFLEAEILRRLEGAKYPARSPADNLADIQAQLAANRQGVREIMKAVDRYGIDVVRAYMEHIKMNASMVVRRLLEKLEGGSFELEMDNGQVIRVQVTVDRKERAAHVDFTGTSRCQSNNFNAPTAITTAAILYVFRCLVADDVPLNAGCLEPLHVTIPDGSFLKPGHPHAVAAGNVETSQCIADALLATLGKLASSQGTMNNFSFGNDRYQYYETICGGAGGGPGIRGADAVHTHMTNSRLTDPEILEMRYPISVDEFSIRRGSGGHGKYPGGDGVVRRIRFHESMSVSILSNRRRVRPYGLEGGGPGLPGRNILQRQDGRTEALPGTAGVEVDAGDEIVIETPGGGGYGPDGRSL